MTSSQEIYGVEVLRYGNLQIVMIILVTMVIIVDM